MFQRLRFGSVWGAAAATLVGCGDIQVLPPTCDCKTPPASQCVGDTLVEYGAGACDAMGVCSYEKVQTTCENGCENAACVAIEPPDLCAGVTCDNPGASTCEGSSAVKFISPGTCDEETGDCEYGSVKDECAATGKLCEAGVCVADPCMPDGKPKACPPPSPACEGETAITYTAECEAGECKSTGTNKDCAADGMICVAGGCVPPEADPCKDVACTDPPHAYCDGSLSWAYASIGTCDKSTGKCDYAMASKDCAKDGDSCDEGVCLADPCKTTVCDGGPADECAGKFAISYLGSCKEGACSYASLADDCAAKGQTCYDGKCETENLCLGVTCASPPPAACIAGVAVTYASAGACTEGNCDYPQESSENCLEGGKFCAAGACVAGDPCEGVSCEIVPEPTCHGDQLATYSGPGVCADGDCIFPSSEVDCAAKGVGYGCEDAACIDKCEDVVCDDPPGDGCVGEIATAYGAGVCAAGECNYPASQTDCAKLGLACSDGACVDPCAGVTCAKAPPAGCAGADVVTYAAVGSCKAGECAYPETLTPCDAPPDPECDGLLAVNWLPNGSCAAGQCVYPEQTVDCGATGQLCSGGLCLDTDPCEGVVCDEPPGPACEGGQAVSYTGPGSCAGGNCKYAKTTVNCAATFKVCEAGACADKCQGVACASPPPDTCKDGTSLTDYDAVGACDWQTGVCSYGSKTVGCGSSQVCAAGACAHKCVVDGCALAASSVCQGDTLLVYGEGGTCDPAAGCKPALDKQQSCPDTKMRCESGACVDKCSGKTCASPPAASCEGEVAVTWEAQGACEWMTGACAYTKDSTNCAMQGKVCSGGACVHACVKAGCDLPAKNLCEGGKAVTYAAGGSCDPTLGCVQTSTSEDCAPSKKVCEAGACVDKCAGVVCDKPPAAACDAGGQAITYSAEGAICAWDTGKCTYPSAAQDCAAEGLVCVGGVCASCPAGQIQTCNGLCGNGALLGNGVCQPWFFCAAFGNDEGDCKLCEKSNEINDCLGGCSDSAWLSNGTCDGAFNCYAFGYDAGACAPGAGDPPATCGALQVPDCKGNCGWAGWVSGNDGICDDAQFNCAAYHWDAGACCPPGQTKDCSGQCRDTTTLGDKICDTEWLCDQSQWDGGDCQGGCAAGQLVNCKGVCQSGYDLGNNACNPALFCDTYAYDRGDCQGACADPTTVEDCDGTCVPGKDWGDGACDVQFLCDALAFDGGDCQGGCGVGKLAGCHGECIWQTKLADQICNLELLCGAYDFDGGDCQGGCSAGEVKDCVGACAKASALDDGACDGAFMCPAYTYDYADCQGGCAAGELVTCANGCLKLSMLGNQACDLELVCAATGWDGGDCQGGCAVGEIRSCTSACVAGQKLGDGTCTPELFCEQFEADRGDCQTTCPKAADIVDCNGKCTSALKLSDAVCDPEFQCATFGFDAGWCPEGPGACGWGSVADCQNQCMPAGWLTDGPICDAGFRCEAFNWDAGECCPVADVATYDDGLCDFEWMCTGVLPDGTPYQYDGGDCQGSCATGQVQSCTGACLEETKPHDSMCQPQLFCSRYNNDAGRCSACLNPTDILNRYGTCTPATSLSDAVCNDEFNDASFNYDAGNCQGGGVCSMGQVPDCNGNCMPAGFLTDGWPECDAGYGCGAYNYDAGMCPQ